MVLADDLDIPQYSALWLSGSYIFLPGDLPSPIATS